MGTSNQSKQVERRGQSYAPETEGFDDCAVRDGEEDIDDIDGSVLVKDDAVVAVIGSVVIGVVLPLPALSELEAELKFDGLSVVIEGDDVESIRREQRRAN